MSYLNGLVVFPTFFNFSLNLAIRLMIWATVSSWSCFCWLYRASPSSAAKNIINLILVLTIWWCLCVESSLLLLEEGAIWPVCSLGKTLLAFALLCSAFQGQICLLLQVFSDFLLLHSSPLYVIREMQIKTSMRYHFIPVRMAVIKKSFFITSMERLSRKGNAPALLVGM